MSINSKDFSEEKQVLVNEAQPLIESSFDHSRYAIFIVVINLGLNFALYGFQNVLSTYLKNYLGLVDSAGSWTNAIAGLTYVIALLSGFIADVFWGLYKTIVVGTVLFFFSMIILFVGNVVFATQASTLTLEILSVAGIILFIVGSGGTKACTSAFLGEQFGPSKEQQEKRSRFYSWYYLSIQFGSIGVSLASPIILDIQPWGAWGLFAILAGSFAIFFPIFLIGGKGFKKRPPQGSVYRTFFSIIGCALRNNRHGNRSPGSHWLDSAKLEHDARLVDEVKDVLRVLLVFAPLPFFWAVFFQMYSVWVEQAESMNTVVGGTIDAVTFINGQCNFTTTGGWNIPAPTTITLNPLFDCFLIPLFASGLYPLLGKCVKVTPLRKMAAGHIFTIAALATAGVVELFIAANAVCSVSVWWIVPQYFLVSVAEILLSVTVYELAYSQAPKSMKGLVTGCMFASIAVGNGLLAALQLIKGNRAITNFAFAGWIGLVFALFVVIAVNYQYRKEDE